MSLAITHEDCMDMMARYPDNHFYKWLLKNYAKEGDKILDTHLGSMSIAIAIHQVNTEMGMNLTLTGCELDEEYFNAGMERVKNQTRQNSLFNN